MSKFAIYNKRINQSYTILLKSRGKYMKIEEFLKGVKYKVVGDIDNLDISNIACDTKDVCSGTCFYCIEGINVDGHSLADVAVDKGAKVIVVTHALDIDIPQIVVDDTRKVMSITAGNYYGNPREKLKLIGITGTNGKTTTTYMLESILSSAGYKVGVIGTIGIKIDTITMPNKLTTPDPIEMHRIFRQMVDANVDIVVMEVSAHAIHLNKMAGIKCDVGVLTNVTQDHLDYFGTFENYASIKSKFLTSEFCDVGVINIDDNIGKEIVLNKSSDITLYTCGINNPSEVFAPKYEFSASGTKYFVNAFDELALIESKLIGKFNLYNALASITTSVVLGVDMQSIVQGLEKVQSVDGRCNVINLSNNVTVVIDYAHTPDGLKNILTAIRPLTKGRLISVFGCGGNRDTTKRAIMGRISGECADYTIITSDNPRLENPNLIINDIEQGISEITKQYMCVVDRKEGIKCALSMANSDDIIVLSGKGAEQYMDVGGRKYSYNDKDAVFEEYEKLTKSNEVKLC